MTGKSDTQIAKELGRTLPSVKCRIAQLHVERFRPRQEQWLSLLSGPHCLKDVARKMGVDYRSAVRAKNRLRKSGLEIPAAIRR